MRTNKTHTQFLGVRRLLMSKPLKFLGVRRLLMSKTLKRIHQVLPCMDDLSHQVGAGHPLRGYLETLFGAEPNRKMTKAPPFLSLSFCT